nr:hypothetical protein [Tanacetum cinerariifolium]
MSNTNNSNTMEIKDTVSSCSVSNDQEMQRLHKKALFLKANCMNGLKALQSNFKILSDDLKDFGGVATFKRTFSQDMNLLEKHLTKEILHEIDYKTALTKLKTMFENTFNSELREHLQKYTSLDPQSVKDTMISDIDFIEKYMINITLHQQEIQQLFNEKKLQTQEVQINTVKALNVDLIIIEIACSGKENSHSETAFNKLVKERSLDSKTKDVHAIKYKMLKEKEKCMAYFRSLHSHLQVLFKEDLKGTRIEHGLKRAFMSLFGQERTRTRMSYSFFVSFNENNHKPTRDPARILMSSSSFAHKRQGWVLGLWENRDLPLHRSSSLEQFKIKSSRGMFLLSFGTFHRVVSICGQSIFANRSDKGFLVRVDQERCVKRVPTSFHRVLLLQSRALKLSKLFQLAYDVHMSRMIPQLVIILEGEMCTSGFPTQSVRSSNAIALDSPYLLVLITGTSQSRQHGFPAQSICTSNAIASDSPYLLDLITEMSQSRQHAMQAYNAISSPQVIIALPAVLLPSLVLSLSPISDSQDFFPSKEISPKDTKTSVSPSSLVASSSPIRSTISLLDYPFDKSIFTKLDNSLWITPRPLGEEPVPEEPNESDTCWNVHIWK